MTGNDNPITQKPATPNNGSSNSAVALFELAEQAGQLFRRSTGDALACGRVLLQAREIAGHGSWLPFLHDAGIPTRTAQDYMQAARYAGDCTTKCATVAYLGIRRTLEFLRARDRAIATWLAACKAEPDNHEVIQRPPESVLSGLAWCDDPADRAIVAEVAAHTFGLDVAELLAAIEPA